MAEKFFYAPGFDIKIGGKKIGDDLLASITSVTISKGINRADSFIFKVGDQLKNGSYTWLGCDSLKMGQEVAIQLGYAGNLSHSVKAHIDKVTPAFSGSSTSIITVEGSDKAFAKLTEESDAVTYKNKKDSDIVKQIASDVGLSAEVDNTADEPQESKTKNGGASYLNYIRSMLEANADFEFFVAEGKLHFKKSAADKSPALTLKWGELLKSFKPSVNISELVTGVVVKGWDENKKEAIEGKATLEGGKPSGPGSGQLNKGLNSIYGEKQRVITDQPVSSKEEANALAKSILEEAKSKFMKGSGVTVGMPEIKPGVVIKLDGLGDVFSGNYYVLETTHKIDENGYDTSFNVGGDVTAESGSGESLLDLLEDPREKAKQAKRINGVVPAVVSNLKDPESLGRIKVNFPWLSETSETGWARVASFIAGGDRGAFFLPEVGDEVLVAFHQGDIDDPYIIGALWSEKDMPPEKNSDGKNNVKLYKSRSGHTITFSDDSEGKKEKIEIKSNAGHTVTLDDASGSEKIEIKDKTGRNKITIDSASKAISIESSMELNLKATNIGIKASGNLKLEATGNLELKGAIIKAQASGIAEIKGAMVKIN